MQRVQNIFTKDLNKLAVLTLLLFIVLYPLSSSINFMQNDDWVHYSIAQSFLNGNYSLQPEIGVTFYVQGIFGALFAKLFSIKSLPILTLIVSTLNFYIFGRILLGKLNLSVISTVLLSLLFFLNPLHIYSIWGFMTENYFLFFTLLSFYYVLSFSESGSNRDFILVSSFSLLAFFVRQNALVIMASFLLYLFLTKKVRYALVQLVFLTAVWYYYQNFFPQTTTMLGRRSISTFNFDYPLYVYTILFGIFIYLAAFSLPLLALAGEKLIKVKTRVTALYSVGIYVLVLVLYKWLFSPHINIHGIFPLRGQFPYFQNVFERTGFLTSNLPGTKYHFPGYFDLFNYWGIVAVLSVPIIILVMIKTRINFFSIFIILYSLSLLFTFDQYDRYLLPLFAATIILFVQYLGLRVMNWLQVLIVTGFISFLLVLNYQYSMDFLKTQKYVWSRAEELVEQGADSGLINAGHAWRKSFTEDSLAEHEDPDWEYVFSYDKDDEDLLAQELSIIEEKRITYPLSFYLKSYVYLYHRD